MTVLKKYHVCASHQTLNTAVYRSRESHVFENWNCVEVTGLFSRPAQKAVFGSHWSWSVNWFPVRCPYGTWIWLLFTPGYSNDLTAAATVRSMLFISFLEDCVEQKLRLLVEEASVDLAFFPAHFVLFLLYFPGFSHLLPPHSKKDSCCEVGGVFILWGNRSSYCWVPDVELVLLVDLVVFHWPKWWESYSVLLGQQFKKSCGGVPWWPRG